MTFGKENYLMFKSKKVLIILVTVVLFVFCLTWLCACKQKDKKYDVTFIITYEQVDEYCNRNYGGNIGAMDSAA